MTETQWLEAKDPVEMLLELAATKTAASNRELRLFACACCRQVWHLLGDERSKRVVDTAERYADGEATINELYQASWGGLGGFISHSQRTAELVRLFYATAQTDLTGFAFGFAEQLRNLGSMGGDWAGEMPDGDWWERWPPVWANLLRDVVGNPFKLSPLFREQPWTPPRDCGVPEKDLECVECGVKLYGRRAPCPRKPPPVKVVLYQPSEEITRLATAAYDERHPESGELEPARLAILADAVEEAGCTEERLLQHLRGRETCPKCAGEGKYRIYPRDQLPGSGPVYSTCWDCNFTTDRRERPGGGVHLGCGFIDLRGPHVRGCWALDLILGKE